MTGFSDGHTLAPLLVVSSCHNPLPLLWPVQGKKRPRSNTCNRQTHHVLTIATHMKVSSQQLTFFQQGGPQVPAQLIDQHPSKVWLRPIRFEPHPLRVHQKVLLAPAVTDTAPSAPQVFHSFQGLFKRHEAYITSTLLSVKSTHDGSKYSSRCSSPCAHLPQSCRTFTRRRLLDVERLSHVDTFTTHRLPTSFVRKQKKDFADRGASLHLLTAIATFRYPWCRF